MSRTQRKGARRLTSKVISSIMAVVLAVGLCPAFAVADSGGVLVAGSSLTVQDDYDSVKGESGTCTWILANGKLTVSPTTGDTGTLGDFEETYTYTWTDEYGESHEEISTWYEAPWRDFAEEITSVVFTGTVKAVTCRNMFSSCGNLETADLTSLDTSEVKDMFDMFYGCSSLTSLDLSSFDTSRVRDMSDMFEECSSLTSLDLSSFDTSRVKNMSYMFEGCSSLTSLDLSGFDNSALSSAYCMFSYCTALKTIYASALWDPEGFYGSNMFYGCTALKGGNGTAFDASMYTVDDEYWAWLSDAIYARIDAAGDPGYFTAKGILLDGAVVTVEESVYKYEGKAIEPAVTVNLDGATLSNGTDYTVAYADNDKAGTATVTVTGTGDYEGTATATFAIQKGDNPMKAAAKAVTANYSEEAQVFEGLLATANAEGSVLYAKQSAADGILVDPFTGKVTLEGGLDAGSYDVKVAVYALGNDNYESGQAAASFKVVVNKIANPMNVKGKKVKVKAKKVEKKAVKVKASKAYKFKVAAAGKVTYKKAKGTSKKLKVNKKTGKITVKAGTAPGTYKAKIKVKAAGTNNYNAKTKKVTVKVTVK